MTRRAPRKLAVAQIRYKRLEACLSGAVAFKAIAPQLREDRRSRPTKLNGRATVKKMRPFTG